MVIQLPYCTASLSTKQLSSQSQTREFKILKEEITFSKILTRCKPFSLGYRDNLDQCEKDWTVMSARCDKFIAIWSVMRIYLFYGCIGCGSYWFGRWLPAFWRNRNQLPPFQAWNTGISGASETYALIYQSIWRHLPYNPYLVCKLYLLKKCFHPLPHPQKWSKWILVGKPEGKRPLGRPRRRWADNIRMGLQEVECGYMDWIGLAQDRDGWRRLVTAVMNLRVP